MWFSKSWFFDTHLNVDSTVFVLFEERANGQEGENQSFPFVLFFFVFFTKILPLCLKTFPENAALEGKTTQSSTYADAVPELAIDGSPETWTHTNSQTDPWWRVDLLKIYRVNRVTITNRINFAYRINGAVICIGNYLNIYSNTMWGFLWQFWSMWLQINRNW